MWSELGDVSVEAEATERDAGVAELYRTRRDAMIRLAYVLTRDAEVADDVVQEAFIALHRNWAGVEQHAAYLRTAIVNACHSHHRRLRTARNVPTERPPIVEAPVRSLDHDLDSALRRLSRDDRVVLALRYLEDLDDVEIAAVLGVSRSTVRTRAQRALDRLRKELDR